MAAAHLEGVLRPQTSFGGGKTHGLIALYHLAKGARPSGLERFVDVALLPDECRITATLGDKFEPVGGIETRSTATAVDSGTHGLLDGFGLPVDG